MNRTRLRSYAPFLLLLFLGPVATGCSSRPALVSVKGTIRIDGKLIAGVAVYFWPTVDRGGDPNKQGYGTAYTDAEGRFAVKNLFGEEGLYAGEYKVTFSRFIDSEGKPIAPGSKANEVYGGARDLMPKRYQDPDTTPEKVKVPGAGLDASFDLKSR